MQPNPIRKVVIFTVVLSCCLTLDAIHRTASMQSALRDGAKISQTSERAQSRPKLSSEGSMFGVTAQRTHAYNTSGINAAPTNVMWKSFKLFSLRSVFYERAETGPFKFDIPHFTNHHHTVPVLADNVIYLSVYNGDGYLVALNATDGTLRNRFKNPGVAVSSLAVASGVVYAGANIGEFYAFDVNTEQNRWKIYGPYSFNISRPVIVEDVVYFGGVRKIEQDLYGNGKIEGIVYAAEASTGKELWRFPVLGFPSEAAIDDGTVCFADDDKHLLAVDSRTGKEKWRFKASSNISAPAIMNGFVYFGDLDSNIYSLELNTGRLKWKTKNSSRLSTLLALDSATIYAGGEYHNIYAVHMATGEEKWKFKIDGRCTTPVLTNEIVYFGCRNKTLYGVDAATGQEKWRYKTDKHIVAPPIIANGTIYFLDAEAYLHAIR